MSLQPIVPVEPFEVTGTRIKRIDTDGPQPVAIYSAQTIVDSGQTTLGDFIDVQPWNARGSYIHESNANVKAAATANPRGLGGNRFLTLIDGRRAGTYALLASGVNSMFDLNSVPLGAIEQVEFLKDGASAIYGSDAITGVVNLKLKPRQDGAELELYAGNTLGHDTFTRHARLLVGGRAGRTSASLGLSWQAANSNFAIDFPRSQSSNYALKDPVKGADLRQTNSWPAYVTLTAAEAAAAGFSSGAGIYVVAGGQPQANPQRSHFVRVGTSVGAIPSENRYDWIREWQFMPEYDYRGAFGVVDHQLASEVTAFFRGFVSHNVTTHPFTSSPVIHLSSAGTSPVGTLSFPATNPYNPFGIDLSRLNYRLIFLERRVYETTSTSTFAVGGLRGKLHPEWSWEAAATYRGNRVASLRRNHVRSEDLQAVLNGRTRTTAFNPFGPSDNPDLVAGLFRDSHGRNRVYGYGGDVSITGRLRSLPTSRRRIGAAAGTEWDYEKLATSPDTTTYIAALAETPTRGDRELHSTYVELAVPLWDKPWSVELQAAARHERYSDFGSALKPKIAAKLRAPRTAWLDVALRGSYSQSFKAPDLGRLHLTQFGGYSTIAEDPLRPQEGAQSVFIVRGGNPYLQPEEADVWFAGLIVESPRLKHLSAGVDYFAVHVTNVIMDPQAGYLLSAQGRAQFPAAVERDNRVENPGPIVRILSLPRNMAAQWYQGFDFNVTQAVPDTRVGSFQVSLEASLTRRLAYDAGGGPLELLGHFSNPKWRGSATVVWRRRAWATSLGARYIGAYVFDAASPWGVNPVTQLNGAVTWRGLRRTEITVGANNLLGTEPPFNGHSDFGFIAGMYGQLGLGRFVYLRVKRAL